MKVPERVKKLTEPIEELLKRLSPAQRVSLIILGAVVVIALGTVVATSPASGRMIPVDIVDTPALKQFLVDQSIDHDIDPNTGKLRVPSDSLPRLYARAMSDGFAEETPDFMSWILGEMSFTETTDRTNKRIQYSRQRNMEVALTSIAGISNAKLDLTITKRRIGVRDTSSSASVLLQLDKNLKRLNPGVARTAAVMVAAAWTIPVSRVVVADTNGYTYRVEGDDMANHPEGRLGREREMRNELARAVFDGILSPTEYSLEVEVRVDRTRESEHKKAYLADDSVSSLAKSSIEESEYHVSRLSGPGVKPNVNGGGFGSGSSGNSDINRHKRTDEDYDNKVGVKDTETLRPAGEELEWSIVARVSKPALIEIIKADKKLLGVEDWSPTPEQMQGAIDGELAQFRQHLENFPTSKASAIVSAFTPLPPVENPAMDDSGFMAYVASSGREIVLAVLAIVACFFLYRLARPGVQELEELPDPVADLERFLREKEITDREAVREQEEAEAAERAAWEQAPKDVQDVELLEQINGYTMERPSVAAGVLKLWINDGDGGSKDQIEEGSDS